MHRAFLHLYAMRGGVEAELAHQRKAEIWPANRPRLRGYEAQEYNAFVRSTTYWLEEIRFRPARIGTCRVRQLVQQPLEYKVVRP